MSKNNTKVKQDSLSNKTDEVFHRKTITPEIESTYNKLSVLEDYNSESDPDFELDSESTSSSESEESESEEEKVSKKKIVNVNKTKRKSNAKKN